MTSAQKTAKANFLKAIEYRKKTGVSLKEAFAKVYGKKTTATKKAAPKKKKIGESNIPKAGAALADRIWERRSKKFHDEFQMQIGTLMATAKDLGYGYPQARAGIIYIVKEIIEFNQENY